MVEEEEEEEEEDEEEDEEEEKEEKEEEEEEEEEEEKHHETSLKSNLRVEKSSVRETKYERKIEVDDDDDDNDDDDDDDDDDDNDNDEDVHIGCSKEPAQLSFRSYNPSGDRYTLPRALDSKMSVDNERQRLQYTTDLDHDVILEINSMEVGQLLYSTHGTNSLNGTLKYLWDQLLNDVNSIKLQDIARQQPVLSPQIENANADDGKRKHGAATSKAKTFGYIQGNNKSENNCVKGFSPLWIVHR
uniref:Uncharacterized protein n=1 Tax=Vespula pensylvanica TaxID=30213 RepID=A0A834K4T3_VESPE|nr:hypothetical protein H0235_015815 [Vespula pensylvanica]